ncbi:CRAL/TRIO domain-containing protein, partial [Ascodesmis nigricans]
FATGLILQKFLRANHNDVARAFLQLQDTMKWRRSFFGPGGEIEKGWDEEKFKGLGYTSVIPRSNSSSSSNDRPIVISWNIYGATKDIRHTFTPLPEFLRWRVALMETTLSSLSLATAVHPIPDHTFGADPYQCLQIHDYLSVSFLRLPKEVREASKQTIELFGRYYPETLEKKVMVNVPAVMGWVFGLVRRVVARETVGKMVVLGRGGDLSGVLGVGGVPGRYGGVGGELEVV